MIMLSAVGDPGHVCLISEDKRTSHIYCDFHRKYFRCRTYKIHSHLVGSLPLDRALQNIYLCLRTLKSLSFCLQNSPF